MSDPEKYTVGCICALTTEFVAMQSFLDKRHDPPVAVAQEDYNNYALGTIGNHNVVVAVLPRGEYGLVNATSVAKDILHTFPNIRFGLMVGIGGGAPGPYHDIRLGDVVVSSPENGRTGVLQYDFGKTIQNKKFLQTGTLNKPPKVLLTALAGLEASYESDGHQLEEEIDKVLQKRVRLQKKYSRPPTNSDKLYKPDFIHHISEAECQDACGEDPSTLVSRHRRDPQAGEDDLTVHYGLIASANTLMKDAQIRDLLRTENDVLCFEMEAAGLMDSFPCLVIRGICDYSDSHKNKKWQGYAAMAAAAYAKDLLNQIPQNKVERERRANEVLSDMQSKVEHLHHMVGKIQTDLCAMRSDSHTANIQQWLSTIDPMISMNNARKRRHAGTGKWLLDSIPFIEWIQGSRRHLWLSGMPGCGKTVLSSTIFDHIIQIRNSTTLFFLFDFQDMRKQKLDDMLRSLILQLYSLRPESHMHVESVFKSHDSGRRQPSASALSACFRDMLQASKNISILLDALDESSQRGDVLNWIYLLQTLPNIQFIATSRLEAEFERTIPNWIGEVNCIFLSNGLVNNDIQSYITHRLDSLEFKRWTKSPDMLLEIQEAVAGNACGIWVACQLDSLAECVSREELEHALQSLPPDLHTTYEHIIENIPGRYKKKAIRLLQFLTYTGRSLALEEAIDIIAVRHDDGNPTTGYFDTRDRLPHPEDIKMYVSSLASLFQASNGELELQLAHFSVQEYLVSRNVASSQDPRACITGICLIYLGSIPDADDISYYSAGDGDYYDDTLFKYPFATRAAEILMESAKHAEKSTMTLEAIVGFLQDGSKFLTWVNLLELDEWEEEFGMAIASPLSFACLNGLEATARRLILDGADINTPGAYHGSPLRGAALRGEEAIVQLLLDQDADVNAQSDSHGSALLAASKNGHRTVVQLLLTHGADVNSMNSCYGSALAAAIDQGDNATAQLLLDHGAEASDIALYNASWSGNEAMVRLLLEHGADVNSTVDPVGSVLQAAVKKGHETIIQLLQEHGAEMNMGDAAHSRRQLQRQ